MISRLLLAAAACVGVAACSSTPAATSADSPLPSVSASGSVASARPAPKPATPPRAALCPARPPANGPLDDQGEQVGKIGASSSTYVDDSGRLLYCVAVVSARRVGGTVLVTVRVVNGVVADDSLTGSRLRGSLPPGGALTGTYGFVVPARQSRVRVTAGPAVGQDRMVWAGTAA